MRTYNITVVLLVLLGALVENYVEGCSCLKVHPQEQYCNSDFVIVARIKKIMFSEHNKIYKARIRKEFKMTEKAKVALKSGRILTNLDGAMCGVDLDVGRVYLISGRIVGLQAHINLCGYRKPWEEVTRRQRKGFRLLYNKGCGCKIAPTYRIPTPKDRCNWHNDSCEENYGICLRSPSGQCNWAKSLDLQKCLKGEEVDPIKTNRKFTDPVNENIFTTHMKYHYRAKKES